MLGPRGDARLVAACRGTGRCPRSRRVRSLLAVARLALVIFDLDDTLFDHEGATREALAGWLVGLGVEPTEELVGAWFAAESRHVAAWHRGELDWQGQRRARVEEMLSVVGRPAGDPGSLERSFGEYLSRYEAAWRVFPDVEPALRALERERLEIAVLSNGADYQQREKLAAVGLSQRIGRVFCSDAIGFAKPDVRAFNYVCEKLGRDPSAVLSVGDRHDLDVVAARAAGLRAVHIDRANAGPADEPCRITSLVDLPRFLTGD